MTHTTKKRYRVFDAYDCYMSGEWEGKPELLGTSDTRQGVKSIVDNRREETDGEMYIIIWDIVNHREIETYDEID